MCCEYVPRGVNVMKYLAIFNCAGFYPHSRLNMCFLQGKLLLGLMLRCSESEIRSNIISQLVFCKQLLPADVLTRVTIEKYAAGLVCNNKCANFAQNLLNRLQNVLTRLTNLLCHFTILPFLQLFLIVDYILYVCEKNSK